MATIKKRKLADIKWIDANIACHIPEEVLANDDLLQRAIEEWNKGRPATPCPEVWYFWPFSSLLL